MKLTLNCIALTLALITASGLQAQTPATNTPTQTDKLPSDKYEQPKYKVIEQLDAIEIREYQPMLMAEVDVEGDRSGAVNAGFRLLAGYIFGGNTFAQASR